MDSAIPQNLFKWRGRLPGRLVRQAPSLVEENRALKGYGVDDYSGPLNQSM